MISFVYFDLGGVAIIDFHGNNKWEELCDELGLAPARRSDFLKLWSQYADELCRERDVETILPILKTKLGATVPTSYSLLRDGFVKRLEPSPAFGPTVEAIARDVPVGLLTNVYPGMLDAIRTARLLPEVRWTTVIDSSVEKTVKPERRIYEIAQSKAGVPGQEILFVDDRAENVAAARALGWQTFLYDPTQPERSSAELLNYWRSNS